MLRSKLHQLFSFSRVQITRLALLAFIISAFTFEVLLATRVTTQPAIAEAIVCSGSTPCESAGSCWPIGFKAGNGSNGCEYTCTAGGWGQENCNTTQEFKDQAAALKNQYEQQQAAGGGGGGGASVAQGAFGSGKCNSAFPTAGVCQGKDLFTQQAGGLWCIPTTGGNCAAVSDVGNLGADTNGDGVLDGAIQSGNQTNGGCPFVVTCSCSSGTKQACLFQNILSPSEVGNYCSRMICSPIGTNGKTCEPGQIIECSGKSGLLCPSNGNRDQARWVAAHACGATTGSAYCVPSSNIGGDSSCIAQGGSTTTNTQGQSVCCYQNQASCSANNAASSCANTSINLNNNVTSANCTTGQNYRRFVGCGTQSGTPAGKSNCYNTCTNGTIRNNVCIYEPGLSCGAMQTLSVAQQAVVEIVRRTTVVPTPTPTPTPTPRPAVCGESCGGSIKCSGSNMACVDGTCRSTQCAPSEQDNECKCKPPVIGPICVDIYASKTDLKLGDQVTFTCAQVNNTERYEFRVGYTTARTGVGSLELTNLAPSSATSNVSQPITVNKIGRYIAQCRPCGPNNLCQEWEPLTNEMTGPELPPANAATTGIQQQSSSTQSATEAAAANNETQQASQQQATESAATSGSESTATQSGTSQ